jgi:nucleotide-binding universal stress UspA family protein
MQNILVATDGSEAAYRAVDVAAEIAKAVGGNLSSLTVGGNLSTEEMRQMSSAEQDLWGAVDSFSKQILGHGMERARRLGVSMAKTHISWGDPTAAILEAVRRESIDTVVVGRRGRGQLAGLLLGSVSQKVVTLAPCIVIVVP